MKKILDSLFSMQLTVVLLLMFALSSAIATFVENDYGTIAARAAIYEATWFEVLLGLLAVNLMGSLVVNKTWQKKKYAQFLFHISFVIILIGAAITRFSSFEGMMHIREGKASNQIVSSNTYLTAKQGTGGQIFQTRQKVLMSSYRMQAPDFSLKTTSGKIHVETLGFIPNAAMVISPKQNGEPIVSMFVSTHRGRQTVVIKSGERKFPAGFSIGLNSPESNLLNLTTKNDSLFATSTDTIFMMSMGSQVQAFIEPEKTAPFQQGNLYSIGDTRIVLRSYEPSGALWPVVSDNNMQAGTGLDAVLVKVSHGNNSVETFVLGSRGLVGEQHEVSVGGETISLSYGAISIPIPFNIKLNEFILDRYPGSSSPSSYASEVTLIDEKDDVEFDFRIFMNNILNYKGYRFYQSSYDTDEKGTVLSVNHDGPGTIVSYLGYFIMAFGMIYALISRKTRFRNILRMITETRKKKLKILSVVLILIAASFSNEVHAQNKRIISGIPVDVIDEDHAAKFGELAVLGLNGRIEPMNTLTGKILRKFTGKSTFEGLTSDQVFLSIVYDPSSWQQVPLFKINNKALRDQLGITGKYASFSNFFDFSKQNSYLLSGIVGEAHQKKSIDQTKYDKEIIKADEKINIFYLVYTQEYLRLFPRTINNESKWFSPIDKVSGVPENDSLFIKNVIGLYAETLAGAIQTGNYSQADEMLKAIDLYQEKFAGEILPSESKQSIEIAYNKYEIFERLFKYYGMLGLLFLFLIFGNLVNPKIKIGIIKKIIVGIIIIMFTFQTLAIAARWYISGYAPLSNGFESMIFIGWLVMIAGLLFTRKSIIILAAATILSSLVLFVAHLNWMNPEVSNLVPVLKSVWLSIHVSTILFSYGFLGIGMILGLFNLFLLIFQNKNNLQRFNLTIKEISLTAEAIITIGLYLLTIGTFMGGVWANESWGRYWGWDPKETWALITILVYAVIVHLNYIPGVMGRYVFNALAVVGFSSVIMTYFGVNYYLSGLHSYAAGDPVPIPTFVYYTIAALAVILVFAYINNFKMKTYMDSLPRKGKSQEVDY